MSFNLAVSKLSEEQFMFLMKNGKRTSVLNNFDFESLTEFSFKFVKKRIVELFKSGNFERVIVEAFNDRGIVFFDCDVNFINNNDLLYFIFWIKDELELWAKNEQQYLSGEPNFELLAAGINELDQFGLLNIIDSLAGGDITKHESIWNMKYGHIFDKQWKSIIEAKVQKKLAKQQSKK